MKLELKKDKSTFGIFLFLFFILFVLIKLKKFYFLGINLESGISVPFVFMLFYYIKKLILISLAGNAMAILSLLLFLAILSLLLLVMWLLAGLLSTLIESKLQRFLHLTLKIPFIDRVREWHIAAGLFVLSFALRLMFLNSDLFDHDAAELAIAVEQTIETGAIQPIVGLRYGLVIINVTSVFILKSISGSISTDTILNATAAFFGSMSVAAVYLLGKELFNSRYGAVASALMLSFSPLFFSLSTYALGHAHSTFFIIASLYLFMLSLKKKSLAYSILSTSFLGASFFIRFPEAAITLAVMLFIFVFRNKIFQPSGQKLNLKQILSYAIPLILFGAAYLFFQGDTLLHEAINNQFLEYSGLGAELFLSLLKSATGLGFFIIVIGGIALWNTRGYLFAPLLFYALAILAFFLFFYTATPRFVVLSLVPAFLFGGVGLTSVKNRYGWVSHIYLLLIIVIMFSAFYPIVSSRHGHSNANGLVRYVTGLSDNSSLIYDQGDYTIFYGYYSGKSIHACPLTDDKLALLGEILRIKTQLDSGNKVFMSQQCFAYGTEAQKANLLNSLKSNFQLRTAGNYTIDNFHKGEIRTNPVNYKIFEIIPK